MSGECAQGSQIDVTLVPGVVSGDVPREHSAIRSVNLLRHEGDAHARQFVHPEHLQDVDVAMTAADENEILDDRSGVVHLAPHGCRRGCPAGAMRRGKSTFSAEVASSSGERGDLCCGAVARWKCQRSLAHARIDHDR